jgi:DNA-binding response OmpR family regulator
MKFLIVEDDNICIKLLTKYFENINTKFIKCGKDVLDELNSNKYDVILLDGILEDNISGEEILKKLNENYDKFKNLFILIISGGFVKIPDKSLLKICHCPKPFSKDKIMDKLIDLIKI